MYNLELPFEDHLKLYRHHLKTRPVYCNHNDGTRFKVIEISNEYVTNIDNQKIPLLNIIKFDLG